MSDAVVSGLDWTAPEGAILQRVRDVLMPAGQPALVRRVGVVKDLAVLQETALELPAAYVIYAQPRLVEATATRAIWRHTWNVVVIDRLAVAQAQAAAADTHTHMLHQSVAPVVLAVSQALHGWSPGVLGFGPLVPEQGPPVAYSDMGNAYVTLRFSSQAVSNAQPGVNPLAGRPR